LKKLLILVLAVMIIISAGCRGASPALTTAPEAATSNPPITSLSTTTSPATTPAISSPPVAAATPPPATISATPTATMEQRLASLQDQLEQQRQSLHIPGMALAVVKDDQVILARGFGVSDLDKKTPVTTGTVFAIGSCTKAFTSALVGMMVDEGKMAWDDPVTKYLPYFKLNIQTDDPTAQLTLEDVLSHRSGFPRMGILTASSKVPIEEVLRDATAAKPYAAFREQFYYSNEVYMSAGVAAAKAAGTDWQTLVKQRVLAPLGMNSTTVTYADALKDSNFSRGYLWDNDIQQYKNKPLRNVDNIAPAGAINSNVLDMANWLRLQLGDGLYQQKRLISAASLEQGRKGYTRITPGIDYGLGWMIRSWKNQTVIEHGGNVDGFSAEVAMLPQSNLGFVLLTNTSVNALPELSLNMVWDTLLGEWTGPATAGTAEYAPYLGQYIANFAEFKNVEFTVLVRNNHLAIDIPGQMVFELKEPDASGKWYFSISEQIAVSFDKDAQGKVTGMRMYQAGLELEIPKKGVEIKPEIPLADLQKYLGSYRSEQMGVTVSVQIQNNRLAIGVPGQMVYELYPPDKDGKWFFRATSTISLKFHESGGGQIDQLIMYQSGQEYVMPRVVGAELPTVEQILKMRQADARQTAFKALNTIRLDGKLNIEQSGVIGQFSLYIGSGGQYRVNEDYGKYGSGITAIDGQHARIDSSFGPFEDLDGRMLEKALLDYPANIYCDWRAYYEDIRVTGSQSLNGKPVYTVELKHGDLPLVTLYIDAANGDILKSETYSLQEGGITFPITTLYEDYRDIQGVRIAYREISSNEQTGRIITTYEVLTSNAATPPGFFTLPLPTPKP
jgi:CubicO group peptidase (beta-lactamase class C family)